MAVITGTGGSITMAGTSGAVLDGFTIGKWSAVFTRDSGDTTPFSVADNTRSATGGNGVMTGSFEGFLDGTTAFDATDFISDTTAAAGIVLQVNNNGTGLQKIVFNGWLSGMSTGAQPGVPNPVSGRFTSTGLITGAKT